MSEFSNYQEKLSSDSEDFVNEYFEDFLVAVKEGTTDFHDFITHDGKLDEHVDQWIDLHEAVDIIENCNNEETDSGLWEGLAPREAITSMAIYSYRNDMYEEVENQFRNKLEDEVAELEEKADSIHDNIDDLKIELERTDDNDEYDELRRVDIENEINAHKDLLENVHDMIDKIQSVIDDM